MLAVKDAANMLGISASMVYDMVRNRQIPHYRIRAKLLFDESELEQWKQERRVESVDMNTSTSPIPRLKHLRLS